MGLFRQNSTLASVIQDIISLINLTVGMLCALAVVIFFWGLVKFVWHSDDAKALDEGKKLMGWGLVALFVLFSLWGILQILNIAFFGGAPAGGGSVNIDSYGNYGGTAGNLDPLH